MIKYRYRIDENTTTETFDLSKIPSGVAYETINEVIEDETPTITEPTVEEIIQTVQSLESQLNDVKEQLNNL
jgi:hypothetical protein